MSNCKANILLAVLAGALCSLGYPDTIECWAAMPRGQNTMGMYTADDGTGVANRDANANTIVRAYLVVTRPTADSLQGWECKIEVPDNVIPTQWKIYGIRPINIASPPDFAVGLAEPINCLNITVIAHCEFLVMTTDPAYFYLHPVSVRPSLPGLMIYAVGNDPGTFVSMQWSSGSESYAIFGINTGPLPHIDGGHINTESQSWGSVKMMYR
ncbi:MAG: hypothetical protein ABIF77_12010 [bacterium]